MKFINVIFAIFILILIVGSGLAAKSGPIEMRNGANITFDGGYIKSPIILLSGSSSQYIDYLDGAYDEFRFINPVDAGTFTFGTGDSGKFSVYSTPDGTNWRENFKISGSGEVTFAGKLTNVTNGESAQDVVTYSQAHSDGVVTVGSDPGCDYVIDYNQDEVQLRAALLASKHVKYVSNLNISSYFNVTSDTIFEGQGGCRIKAAPGYSATYMMIVNGSNSSVRDVIIDGNKSYTVYSEWGITVEGTNNTLERCVVEHVSNRGILVTGDHNTLRDCEVYDIGLPSLSYTVGISLYQSDYNVVDNCKVARIDWKDPNDGGFGIYTNSVIGGSILNCHVTDASDYIFISGGVGVDVSHNYVDVSSYNESGSYKIGIDMGRGVSVGCTVNDNRISGARCALYSEGCYNCTFNNNVIKNAEYGIFHYPLVAGGLYGLVMNDNVITGRGIGSGIEILQATDDIDNIKNIAMNSNSISSFLVGIYGHASSTATNWDISVTGNSLTKCSSYSIYSTGGSTAWTCISNRHDDSGGITLAGTNDIAHNG